MWIHRDENLSSLSDKVRSWAGLPSDRNLIVFRDNCTRVYRELAHMMPLDPKMTAKYNHLEMGNILIFQPDLSAEEFVFSRLTSWDS